MARSSLNLDAATILLTGGTGSFGRAFIQLLLSKDSFNGVVRVFSRDEFKQYLLQRQYPKDQRLRFFIGDVRDERRLERAMHGADAVVHAAALKQIVTAEYNPFEVVKTNIIGSQHVVDAALNAKIKKAILVSSDKAVHPINLYGATKLGAARLFIQGNVYAGKQRTYFSVARYGNVLGSRGSVVPLFLKQKQSGTLTITHPDMTRFWITLPRAAEFVARCLQMMEGGEIFVPKLPSVSIHDVAKAVAPDAHITITAIRPGEKLHEELITEEESLQSKEFHSHFVLYPQFEHWLKGRISFRMKRNTSVKKMFSYASNNNVDRLSMSSIKQEIDFLLASNGPSENQHVTGRKAARPGTRGLTRSPRSRRSRRKRRQGQR